MMAKVHGRDDLKETDVSLADHQELIGEVISTEKWASHQVIWLLEVTHGQWLYCNIQVHDKACGSLWTWEKEQLQAKIEDQM